MIGAAIGAVAGLASNIIGGVISHNKAKKALGILRDQQQKNNDWYARRYNEDYLQTALAQSAITSARDYAKRTLRAARGTQAVMGGTEESVAAAQDSANGLISDTLRGLAANGTVRKDQIEEDYRRRDFDIANSFYKQYTQQADNAAAAGSAGMKAGMDMLGNDLSSHLYYGRGMFESAFRKNRT